MSEEDWDPWEPSPEDVAAREKYYAMTRRYPTLLIVMQVVHSYARLKKMMALGAPEQMTRHERELLDGRLDKLCAAMPFDETVDTYPFRDLVDHFRQEILLPPGEGEDA